MFNFQKNESEKIKKIAEDFLRKIDSTADVKVSIVNDEEVLVEAKVSDFQDLMGRNTETLMAIQHLLRVILRKSDIGSRRVDLDINDYKKKRKEYLKEMASAAADEAALLKKEKILPPLGAYERRIVHMELSGREDVVTESRGIDPERRIVVKPAV